MSRPIFNTNRSKRAIRAIRSAIEGLESRQMLANDPLTVGTFKVGAGSWLNIIGSANDDTIVVQRTASTTYQITNGTWSLTKTGSYAGVRVLGGGGGDQISSTGSTAFAMIALGEAGNDTISGGSLNDSLNGGAGDDVVDGALGNDTVLGELGNDMLTGNDGTDLMSGGAGNDVLNGGSGNDTLNGDAGDDTLTGDAGNDSLTGGVDNDSVDGGDNNDKVVGDLGNDVYIGGANIDTFEYTGRTVSVSISLDGTANDGATGETDNVAEDFEYVTGGNGNDSITGNDSANFLYGGSGNDTISGVGGDDKIFGGAGLDSILGDDGNDTLFGQTENDALFGGAGEDLLEGGAGNDRFDGGAGRDRLIAIGGGTLDSLTGGEGLDSYWLDKETTETLLDVSDEETAARATHRITAFVKYGATVISKEVNSPKLAEPAKSVTASTQVVSFASNKLFADAGPSANDIAQGQVGDCWYLSSLAAIAKTNPEVLRQAMTDLGDGTYAVRFYNPTTSAEQYVRVDADFYTYSFSSTTPVMVGLGAENSIWAPILEKALTWVRGSKLGQYATISGGWMNEAFSRLGMTNTVTWRGSISNASAMVDWIRDQLNAGKAVTTGFNAVSGANLVGNHAYTVDRLNDNGDGTYSITLRNPWGVDNSTSTDGNNDGYVTLTSAELFSNYVALMAAA